MNQFDLLGAVLSLFNKVKLDDTSWLVSIDADDGAERSLEFCVLSIVPDMVAGSGPASTPWKVILSQATWAILSFSPCAFTCCPDHHPALIFHLPVPTIVQKTLLTQHLQEDSQLWKSVMCLLHVDHDSLTDYILSSFSYPHVILNPYLLLNFENWISLICKQIIQTRPESLKKC